MHGDEQVYVTVSVRRAVGVGTEQDDLVRMKRLHNAPREVLEQFLGHFRTQGIRERRLQRGLRVCRAVHSNSVIGLAAYSTTGSGRLPGEGSSVVREMPRAEKSVASTSAGVVGRSVG